MKPLRIIIVFLVLHSACSMALYAQWQKTSLLDSLGTVYTIKSINHKIFVGTENGYVMVSEDHGNTWSQKNNGIPINPYPYSSGIFAFDTMGNILFTAGINGLYSSLDTGNTWKLLPLTYYYIKFGILDTTPVVETFAISEKKIFAITLDSGLQVSTDTGKSWKTTSNGFNLFQSKGPFSVFHAGRNRLLAGQKQIINLSKDNGGSWAPKRLVTPIPIFNVNPAHFVQKGNIIYVATEYGNVFVSADSGETWRTMNNGLREAGTTYNITANAEAVFAACFHGIYMLPANDTTWINISENSGLVIIFSVGVDDTYLYAGLYSGGVWRRPLSEIITGIKDISPQKSGIKVYPNPTDNSVNIEIENINLSKQEVAFILYDSAGKKVKQIKVPQNKFKIDKGNLLPGVYLYELRQQKNILYTGKLVIQ